MRFSARFSAVQTADLWVAGLLAAGVALLFHATPHGFWREDDPYILIHALQSPGLSAFFDAEDWRRLSPANLTPWVTLSFKIDFRLAGLSPAFFYAHQLVSLWLAALALYVLARHWLPWPGALAAGALFLAGAPTASVAEHLMTRHYLEGLLFALVSLIAFLTAERRRQLVWAIVGAAFYALATTAKEIYVPLPCVLLCLPPGASRAAGEVGVSEVEGVAGASSGSRGMAILRARWRYLVPYAGVAALYVLWRWYMLGGLLGGYVAGGMAGMSAEAMHPAAVFSAALAAFARLPQLLFGGGWWLPAVLLSLMALLVAIRRPAAIPLALALPVCLLAPLAPLGVYPGIHAPDRYVFLLWCAVSLLGVLLIRSVFGARMDGRGRQFLAGVLFLCLFVPAAVQQHALSGPQQAMFHASDVQSRFLMESDGSACLVPSRGFELIALMCERIRQGEEFCPQFVVPDVPLARPCASLARYDPATGRMVEGDEAARRLMSENMAVRLDETRPLSARMSIRDGLFRWTLGPYPTGSYSLASSAKGRLMFPGRQGSLPASFDRLSMRILYESPEGWKTISPLLTVSREKPLVWEREVERAEERGEKKGEKGAPAT